MVINPPPGAPPASGLFGLPRLLIPELALFPYRQKIPVVSGGIDRTSRLIRESLSNQGFAVGGAASPVVSVRASSLQSRPISLIVAERNVRHDSAGLSLHVTIWALVGCGVVLGVVDSDVIGSWVILVPWVTAFAAMAFVFWYAFGRCYRSEVVMVVLEPEGGSSVSTVGVPGVASSPHTVTWFAGRVRSETRNAAEPNSRRPVRVDPALDLVRVLADLIKDFKKRMDGPPGS
jgi:hypothetical protein